MNKNALVVPFHAQLNEKDTETQTYGCRQNNPDICINNGLTDVCAFARTDGICKKPSRAWKKQYKALKDKTENGERER